jgi:hypothetical protein
VKNLTNNAIQNRVLELLDAGLPTKKVINYVNEQGLKFTLQSHKDEIMMTLRPLKYTGHGIHEANPDRALLYEWSKSRSPILSVEPEKIYHYQFTRSL